MHLERPTQRAHLPTRVRRATQGLGWLLVATAVAASPIAASPVAAQAGGGKSDRQDVNGESSEKPREAREKKNETSTAEGSDDPMEHFRIGREHYQAGRYREAAVELKRAYDLDPKSPTLVYNLARVYELLPDHQKAIEHYERYHALLLEKKTAKNPLTDELEQAEMAIQRVRGAMAAQEANGGTSPESTTVFVEVPADKLRYGKADKLFWLVGAGSTVALIGGTMLGVVALTMAQRLDNMVLTMPSDGPQYDAYSRQLRRVALATDIVLGLSIAGFAGAAALYFLRPADDEKAKPGKPELQVHVAPGAALFTIGGAL